MVPNIKLKGKPLKNDKQTTKNRMLLQMNEKIKSNVYGQVGFQ